MDFLGDIGGVAEVLTYIIGILLFPISEFSFFMKASQLLYKANTKDDKLLLNDPNMTQIECENTIDSQFPNHR